MNASYGVFVPPASGLSARLAWLDCLVNLAHWAFAHATEADARKIAALLGFRTLLDGEDRLPANPTTLMRLQVTTVRRPTPMSFHLSKASDAVRAFLNC